MNPEFIFSSTSSEDTVVGSSEYLADLQFVASVFDLVAEVHGTVSHWYCKYLRILLFMMLSFSTHPAVQL